MERGYRRRSVLDTFDKLKSITREQALKKVSREKTQGGRNRFVVRYDPRLPDIRKILTNQWKVLTEDQRMRDIFPKKPMVCYQRVQNLGEILTRAKLPPVRPLRPRRQEGCGFKPCKQPKCPICDQLVEKRRLQPAVTISSSGENHVISGTTTCTSSNVVYCITCTRGGRVCPTHPQYIGETGRAVRERLKEHRGTITQLGQVNTTAPVGVHFRQPGHSYSDLVLVPIEKIRSRDPMVRKVREQFYINKFSSVENGLNKKSC